MATSARASGLARQEPVRRITALVGILLAVAGLNHLLRNVYYAAGDTGFDFRYLWVAGRMWVDGADPYGSAYPITGSTIIPNGHVPELWAYPPSWWPISSALALFGIERASALWNLFGVALCLASSFLIVSAFRWAYSESRNAQPIRDVLIGIGFALPLLHFFGTAALEATTLVIALGQTSLLIYFGIALLLFGISRRSQLICAAALSIIFLKPQIGIAFAALFLVYSGWSRQTLGWAIALTILMAIPALIIDPHAPLDMVANMARYDGVLRATLPQVTTGIRYACWLLSGYDLGGLLSVAIVAAATIICSMILRRMHEGDDEMRVLWLCTTVAGATTLALAPLHYYDFVMIACLMPALLISPFRFTAIALLGTALVVRADTLGKLTGLYDHQIKVFEGSLLSTIGGLLLLLAALGAASQISFLRAKTRNASPA